MSLDPNIPHGSDDPGDGEERSDDPRVREVQELEARMRRALASKEDPLHDDESTAERLRRHAREDAGAPDEADGADDADGPASQD